MAAEIHGSNKGGMNIYFFLAEQFMASDIRFTLDIIILGINRLFNLPAMGIPTKLCQFDCI